MSRSLRGIGNLQTPHAEEMHDVSSLPLGAHTNPTHSPPGARRVGLSSMLLLMIAAFGVGFGAGWGADKAAHTGHSGGGNAVAPGSSTTAAPSSTTAAPGGSGTTAAPAPGSSPAYQTSFFQRSFNTYYPNGGGGAPLCPGRVYPPGFKLDSAAIAAMRADAGAHAQASNILLFVVNVALNIHLLHIYIQMRYSINLCAWSDVLRAHFVSRSNVRMTE